MRLIVFVLIETTIWRLLIVPYKIKLPVRSLALVLILFVDGEK